MEKHTYFIDSEDLWVYFVAKVKQSDIQSENGVEFGSFSAWFGLMRWSQ